MTRNTFSFIFVCLRSVYFCILLSNRNYILLMHFFGDSLTIFFWEGVTKHMRWWRWRCQTEMHIVFFLLVILWREKMLLTHNDNNRYWSGMRNVLLLMLMGELWRQWNEQQKFTTKINLWSTHFSQVYLFISATNNVICHHQRQKKRVIISQILSRKTFELMSNSPADSILRG